MKPIMKKNEKFDTATDTTPNKSGRTLEHQKEQGNAVRRFFFALAAIALQIVWVYFSIYWLSEGFPWANVIIRIAAVFFVLFIYGRRINSAVKMPWIILIMLLPLFGILFYLAIGLNGSTKRMRRRYERIDAKIFPALKQGEQIEKDLAAESPSMAGLSEYLHHYAMSPVFRNTDVTFYPDTDKAYEGLLKDLANAQDYIFMEYHAIEYAQSFSKIHKILKERAAAGVEVRIFYDYVGSMVFINDDFIKRMEADGIRCRVFNPMMFVANVFLNNRDHRKITVVDGKIGHTGGYNLADEYFNITSPYGKWLDNGVRLEGDAVTSMTAEFLENWNAIRDDDEDDVDPAAYLEPAPYTAQESGFVQPYMDTPLDQEHVGENVYLNLINSANQYIYFVTPYLIITDEMNKAFELAAKRGVDVRIITPGIPDKKIIYSVTRSYYAGLARSGVHIYEYTPGFSHAKMCVSDDTKATCGTINLDYRSFYHHFENGVFMYECDAITKMKENFDELFPQCVDITEKYRTGRSSVMRIGQCILRLFASIM